MYTRFRSRHVKTAEHSHILRGGSVSWEPNNANGGGGMYSVKETQILRVECQFWNCEHVVRGGGITSYF